MGQACDGACMNRIEIGHCVHGPSFDGQIDADQFLFREDQQAAGDVAFGDDKEVHHLRRQIENSVLKWHKLTIQIMPPWTNN